MPRLSERMRDLLIEHILEPQVPFRKIGEGIRGEYQSRYALILAGLILPVPFGSPAFTEITEKGRLELARALADWADALWRLEYEGDGRVKPLSEGEIVSLMTSGTVAPTSRPVSEPSPSSAS